MSTSAANTNATDKKWKAVTDLIDDMQAASDKDDASVESLVQCLAEGDLLSDCLTKKGQLTVVYWPYNKADYKIVLGDASLIENVTTKEEIHKVILNNSIVSALSCDECLSYGFYNCGSLIIVPMRIDKKRSIGAFIFQSELGGTLEEEKSDRHILDTISDRLAIFIRYVNYRDRANVIQEFFDNSFKRGNSTVSDKNIIQDALNFLGKRFSIEEVSVFLRHPFDKNSMFAICEDGKLLDNFHSDGVRNIEDLSKFFGDISVEKLLATDDNVIEFKGKLPDGYHSYAIAPMRTKKQHSIGFFVLRNKHHECAYDDDKILLSRFADITAVNLRNNRRDKINDFLKILNRGDFDNYFLDSERCHDLYSIVGSKIEEIYGFVSFIVVSIENDIDKPKVEYQYRYGKRVVNCDKDISLNDVSLKFEDEIKNIICDRRIRRSDNEVRRSPILKKGYGKLFPMSFEDNGLLTRIFIIESSHSLPNNLKAFLGDLLSSIGIKQSLRHQNLRFQALTDFGKEITAQESLALKDVYELAYKYTERVMSASNMYIALLDEETREISFPCFFQKRSDHSEVTNIKVDSRLFDKNSKKMGRTECILATGKPILILTKEESKRWYSEVGHENKIKDTFASWIGVPIVSEGQNIGVIVLYHISEDYLYSQSDIIFLENISSHISDLLARLDNRKLEEANKKLQDALSSNAELKQGRDLLEVQGEIIQKIVANTMRTTVRDALRDIETVLDYSAKDIEKAIEDKSFSWIKDSARLQREGLKTIQHLFEEIDLLQKDLSNHQRKIDVQNLLELSFRNDIRSSKLDSFNVFSERGLNYDYSVFLNEAKLAVFFHLIIRGLFNVIQTRSFDVELKFSFVKKVREIYVTASVKSNTLLKDNIFMELFEQDKDLKRARLLAQWQLGGDVLLKKRDGVMDVIIKIPSNISEQVVFIQMDVNAKIFVTKLKRLFEDANKYIVRVGEGKDISVLKDASVVIVDRYAMENGDMLSAPNIYNDVKFIFVADAKDTQSLRRKYQDANFLIVNKEDVHGVKEFSALNNLICLRDA